MAGTTITDFMSSFTQDLARPSRFDVFIPAPPGSDSNPFNNGIIDMSLLSFRCETAQLPGKHLSTVEQKTYGPFEKFPFHASYGDVDMTFIVDGDMIEKVFFDYWIDYINSIGNYDTAYKTDYCSDITINQYDVTNKNTYAVTLVDAFPINVNQLDLDWSSDGHHKLTVTFAYTYWYNPALQSSDNPSNFTGTVLNENDPTTTINTEDDSVTSGDTADAFDPGSGDEW
jgi:hypothetical protein